MGFPIDEGHPKMTDIDVHWTRILACVRRESDDLAQLMEHRCTMRLDQDNNEIVLAMPLTDHAWLQRNPLMEDLLRRSAVEVVGWQRTMLEVCAEHVHALSPSAFALMVAIGDIEDEEGDIEVFDAAEGDQDNDQPDTDGQPSDRTSPFDLIKIVSGDGSERWSSRDLYTVLGYGSYNKFREVIKKAEIACIASENDPGHHFSQVGKMVELGSGSQREIDAIHLTRFACYLVAMNGDSKKPVIGRAQAYFAVQTRRQEIADQLREDSLRVRLRDEIAAHHRKLFEAARDAGVITQKDFAIFQDSGYAGLYNGLKQVDIRQFRGIVKGEKILDRMGSAELAANFFRVTQTEEKLKRDGITEKDAANRAHLEVGRRVRQAIEEIGGRMPEDMLTPDNIKEARKRVKNTGELPLP